MWWVSTGLSGEGQRADFSGFPARCNELADVGLYPLPHLPYIDPMKGIKKIRLNLPLHVDPNVVTPRWKPIPGVHIEGRKRRVAIETLFYKPGNRAAAKENISEDANRRRVMGILKGLASQYKLKRGVALVSKAQRRQRSKDIERQAKERVRLTVAKEARDVQDMCRQSASQAIEVARVILADPFARASDRLAAANFITERAYGKATQTNVNASVDANGNKKEISAEELDQRVATALDRVERITGRAAKPTKGPDRPVNIRKRYRHPGSSTVN